MHAARHLRFTTLPHIIKVEETIALYMYEATSIAIAGLKATFKQPSELAIVEKFPTKLDELPAFKAAFNPHHLAANENTTGTMYPKQAKTQADWVEKAILVVLGGIKSLH